MSATLVHRGPDSFGEFSDGDVALAARRLSIIDLETGDQPIANENGTLHVVQTGEIYNYRELRRELERAGHRFRTQGDTEVLIHLYEEHGDRFAERLGGKWPIPVLVGIFPLTSHRLALRLHNEVPGILVPQALQDALERAGSDAAAVGFAHARELIATSRERAAGVYLVAPFRRPLRVLELLAD